MAAGESRAADAYASAALECDIVMKGGITSGVVYPGAVLELAKRYRFRSIGGTSAGAVAAAIVAAAEHRRRAGGPGAGSGFEAVAALPEALAHEEGGRSLLLRLFQPDRRTRPLFSMALGCIGAGPLGGIAATVRAFPRFPAIAAALALAAIVLGVTGEADRAVAVAAVCVAATLAVAGLVADVVRAALRLPGNHFGLCTLGPQSVDAASQPALTDWLHERIQTISGRGLDGPVLTFADLWGVDAEQPDPDARRRDLLERSRQPHLRAVDLQMMTTDLTHGRPWRLPVPHQPRVDRLEEGGELLFDPEELARFFPAAVVAHLARCGGDPSPKRAARLAEIGGGRTFKRFPIGPDLPVVVATRMSLSFPLLISAIPLWQLDFDVQPTALLPVLFSDGGISSNFPVHFFDSPLPTRPTFGLHLTGFPPGERAPEGDDAQRTAVIPPPRVTELAPPEAAPVTTLLQFATAIKDAAQNWRDNVQARQPGFRDRIVHIRLGRGEGGLNLTMDSAKVRRLSARGACAGRILVDRFAGPDDTRPSPAWNDHRFVRFRITMGAAEVYLRDFRRGYDQPIDPRDGVTTPYPARIAAGRTGPYEFRSDRQLLHAEATTQLYRQAVPPPEDTLTRGTPRPPSALRTVPPT